VKPLAIIPTYVRATHDVEVFETTLRTLRETAGDACDVMVVDDRSPDDDLRNALARACHRYDALPLVRKKENEGFARTVNVGLKMCLREGRDAVLVNADIEFGLTKDWLGLMQRQRCHDALDAPASVVGGLLVYPNGLIQHGGIYFCSPGDEPVLTAGHGYVSMSELDPLEHGLVGYARQENRIFRCATEAGRRSPGTGRRVGGYGFQKGATLYTGDLINVQAGACCTRVTPNHRLTIHWTDEALSSYAVYVMRSGGNWRVGHTKMAHGGTPGRRGWALGPRLRLDQQRGDEAWVVSLHPSKQSALESETYLAWFWGVPTLQFQSGGKGLEQSRLDHVWGGLDSVTGATALLRAYGRDPALPLLTGRHLDGRRRAPVGPSRRYEIAAANLMARYMKVPTDPGSGQKPEALPIELRREQWSGLVYSLDVEPHHHYVSGGVVVHNSMLTRDFGHRFQFGPGNLPEAQHATTCPVTGALQFIRHECLATVGLYDESFHLGWEDVDYCARVWLSGRQCIYQPGVRAVHRESYFRGRQTEKLAKWTADSWLRFCGKYQDVSFAEFVPNMLG
jgi:GT2 family glycosyltransferase